MLRHPYVQLRITVENTFLHFFVRNSRPALQDTTSAKVRLPAGQGNIGLKNVKKRLQLLYPYDHELNIAEEAGSFSVYLKLRLIEKTPSSEHNEVRKPVKEYAVG